MSSISKVKRDLNNLKKDLDNNNEEPNYPNFFRFCEKYYGHPVHAGELWSSEYYVGNNNTRQKVKPNPLLFLRLSEKYFKEIHEVENPIKDGEHGVKQGLAIEWVMVRDGKSTPMTLRDTMDNDKLFNRLFEDAWNDIIVDGDFRKFNLMNNEVYIKHLLNGDEIELQ